MGKRQTVGRVTSIDDPAKAGRVKVSLSEMDGAEYPEWLDPELTPGWHWLPEVGDSVTVEMPEGTDVVEFSDEVRWCGQALDQSNPVAKELRENYPKRRGFKTKAGHLLIVDDKAGAEEITLSHKGTLVVSLGNAGIFFGTKSASEPFVLGTAWKTLMEQLLDLLAQHTHMTVLGPSMPPEAPWVAQATVLKAGLPNQLSDFIFGQKAKP